MANRQTRLYRKVGLATKVNKGTPVPKKGNPMGESLTEVEVPSTKGRTVNSSVERANRGKKPWRGAGDPLGRNRN